MRKLFLISILLLASTSSHAEENKGDWIADAKTGCKVWNPVPASDESIIWSGKCKDGKGKITRADGVIYEDEINGIAKESCNSPAGRFHGKNKNA